MPPCAAWWGETDNWVTTPFGYCPSTVFLPVLPQCTNARQNRCHDFNSSPLGELEETTRTDLYYVDEDYPAGPEMEKTLSEWSNRRGPESSTLKTADRCLSQCTPSGACQKWMNEWLNNHSYWLMGRYGKKEDTALVLKIHYITDT